MTDDPNRGSGRLLALPLTEQSEFLSWLAPREEAWSIQPEPGRSPDGARKSIDLVPPSSPADGEEPVGTALHPALPVTTEQAASHAYQSAA